MREVVVTDLVVGGGNGSNQFFCLLSGKNGLCVVVGKDDLGGEVDEVLDRVAED